MIHPLTYIVDLQAEIIKCFSIRDLRHIITISKDWASICETIMSNPDRWENSPQVTTHLLTNLHAAEQINNLRAVRILRSAIGDINSRKQGPLLASCVYQQHATLKIEAARAKKRGECLDHALKIAYKYDDLEMMRTLLDNNATPLTYLLSATTSRHYDMVELITEYIDVSDPNVTPFHETLQEALYLAYNDCYDEDMYWIMVRLLDTGVSPEQILLDACKINDDETVATIMAYIPEGDEDMLLDAIDVAFDSRNLNILKMLLEAGATPKWVLQRACISNDSLFVQELVQYIPYDDDDNIMLDALRIIYSNNNLAILEQLLEYINTTTATSLLVAIKTAYNNNDMELMDLLMQ